MGNLKNLQRQKKNIKEYKVESEHFEWGMRVIVGETIDDAIDHAMEAYGADASDSLAFTIIHNVTGDVLVGIGLGCDEASLWHEAIHVAYRMMEDRGITTDQEEVMAYTQSFFVYEFKKCLKKFNDYIHN